MITPAMPALRGGGLAMRMGLFLKSLASIAEVDVLVLPLGGMQRHHAELDSGFGSTCKIIPLVGREDTQLKLISRIADPVKQLIAFRSYGRSSLAAYLSAPVMADIIKATAGVSYDLVHVGRCYLAEAGLAVQRGARLTLDSDEDDAQVFRRRAALDFADQKRNRGEFLLAEAEACESLQRATLAKFDLVFASSNEEAKSLSLYRNDRLVSVVFNTLQRPKQVMRNTGCNTLLFVGSLGYLPNRDGLKWFVREVWPLLQKGAKKPLQFLIVGRGCPPDIRNLNLIRGISVYEDVESLAEFYARADVAVVPLFVGGGTRIKIIEAALHGVPVVSTSLGAAGLSFKNGQEIWLADDAQAMAACIVSALSSPERAVQLGEKARFKAIAEFDFDTISKSLACQWTELLAQPH